MFTYTLLKVYYTYKRIPLYYFHQELQHIFEVERQIFSPSRGRRERIVFEATAFAAERGRNRIKRIRRTVGTRNGFARHPLEFDDLIFGCTPLNRPGRDIRTAVQGYEEWPMQRGSFADVPGNRRCTGRTVDVRRFIGVPRICRCAEQWLMRGGSVDVRDEEISVD